MRSSQYEIPVSIPPQTTMHHSQIIYHTLCIYNTLHYLCTVLYAIILCVLYVYAYVYVQVLQICKYGQQRRIKGVDRCSSRHFSLPTNSTKDDPQPTLAPVQATNDDVTNPTFPTGKPYDSCFLVANSISKGEPVEIE